MHMVSYSKKLALWMKVPSMIVLLCLVNSSFTLSSSVAQTRASSGEIKPGKIKVETIAQGLSYPWGLAFLPDGSILVTEREGRLRLVKNGELLDEPIANTPAPHVQSQAGFFDILLHPEFEKNAIVYLSFAHGTAKENTTRIVKATYDGAALQGVIPIFDSTVRASSAHYGGRMIFLPDNTLLMTTGDGYEYRTKAQTLDNTLGKIIRLSDDGSVPSDNPYASEKESGADPSIWTYGHRSPQGLVLDPLTNVVYAHEHGPRGGDEINVIEVGTNYGWPLATDGIDYSGAQITPFKEYPGTQGPLKNWTPSIAPSGFAVYRGTLFPDWDGDLFVGALAGRALHRVIMDEGEPVGEELLLTELGERIRDVRLAPDGSLYVTTDSSDGKILRLTPAE